MILEFKNWIMTEEKKLYSCVMASFPATTFVSWSKNNINPKDLYEEEGGLEEESHVTVLYGLHTDNYKDLEEVLNKQQPFKINFDKIGKFTLDKYDVLKIEIESQELRNLNKKLRDNFKYTTDYPDYKPHCTLAYVKKNTCDKFLNNKVFAKKSINIQELIFSSSQREKHKFNLKGIT